MNRLTEACLPELPSSVSTPLYRRDALRTGIVHLGIGAFHRAHQSAYTESVVATNSDLRWGIVGVSLRSPSVRDQLEPQDGLYTIQERDSNKCVYRVVGVIKSVLVAPEDPQAVVGIMADDAVKVVSLTITEKGYCHDPASGQLQWDHPDILHDLQHLQAPRTAIGFICAALLQRWYRNSAPFTVLSCDNLANNGKLLRAILLAFAGKVNPDFRSWLESHLKCPCTMVDRIVPATTENVRNQVQDALGVIDKGVVITEPFHQWVIEDNFSDERPAWEDCGALLVGDISAYEEMKLRMLNGSHSALAYLGYLAGYEYVHQVMNDPAFVQYLQQLMREEVAPTLAVPQGIDLDEYREWLLRRFSNTALCHRTWQIAMDGSQKLPQRLLNTVRQRLAADKSIRLLALAVAGWLRYLAGRDEQGADIDVSDPRAGQFRALIDSGASDIPLMVQSCLNQAEVFGPDLGNEMEFVSAVSAHLESLYTRGAKATVAALVNQPVYHSA